MKDANSASTSAENALSVILRCGNLYLKSEREEVGQFANCSTVDLNNSLVTVSAASLARIAAIPTGNSSMPVASHPAFVEVVSAVPAPAKGSRSRQGFGAVG